MASPRTFALSALRTNICRQCRNSTFPRDIHIGFTRPRTSQRSIRPALVSVRWHSVPAGLESRVYDFSEIKELSRSASEDRILIDVREPSEYEAGFIPGAINIPIKSQADAMYLPADEFEDRFGFSKPSADKEVVFYCKSGVRSAAAAQLAKQIGYKNVSEYRGSWMDWEKNGGQASKP